MSDSILIAADVHLAANRDESNARFFRFLAETARDARLLFILGDLFDVWTGDDDDSPLAMMTKSALATLTVAGVPVFIQRGNRDFLLGTRFIRDTGCTLLPDEYVLIANSSRWLLTHGDALTKDPAYQRYRRWGRPPLAAAAGVMPRRWRQRLAARMRQGSRGGVQQAVFDAVATAARLRRHGCHNLVHGHFHLATESCWEDGGDRFRRFSLPDWNDACGGYAALQNGVLSFAQAA